MVALRRVLIAVVLAAPCARAQQADALPVLVGADVAVAEALGLGASPLARAAVPSDAPRSPTYWLAVGVDVAVTAGGLALLGASAVALADPDGFSALPAMLVAVTGATLAVAGGVDLVRVARGEDPFLLRPLPRPQGRPPVLR